MPRASRRKGRGGGSEDEDSASPSPTPSNESVVLVGSDGDDDDDEEAQLQEALRRSMDESFHVLCESPPKRARGGSSPGAAAASAGPMEIISLLSDEEDGGDTETEEDSGGGDDDGGDGGGGKVGAVDCNLGRNGRPTPPLRRSPRTPPRRGTSAAPAESEDVVVLTAPEMPAPEPIRPAAPSSRAAASASSEATPRTAARRSKRKRSASKKGSGQGEEEEEEVEAVGVANAVRLPHMRQHCAEHRFVQDVAHKRALVKKTATVKKEIKEGLEANPKRCELCYCYVCDVRASECERWSSEGVKSPADHCLASDRGLDAGRWKKLREEKRGGDDGDGGDGDGGGGGTAAAGASADIGASGSPASLTGLAAHITERAARAAVVGRALLNARHAHRTAASPARVERMRALQERLEALYGGSGNGGDGSDEEPAAPAEPPTPFRLGAGPWKPDHPRAAQSPDLTRCRLCRWYSYFEHRNFTRRREAHGRYLGLRLVPDLHPVGEEDWCHACGRVASEKDFGKEKSRARALRDIGDVHLGTKEISFRIRARDPRRIDAFKDRWAENEGKAAGWKYSEEEMEEEMFRHRFGERPTLPMILASIPVVDGLALPSTGAVTNPLNKTGLPGVSWIGGRPSRGGQVAASETEALLLDNRNHTPLFEELDRFGLLRSEEKEEEGRNGGVDDMPVHCDIRAVWDKTQRRGTFTIRLFLKRSAFIDGDSGNRSWWKDWPKIAGPPRLSLLLGAWYDVFPFSLADLTNGVRVRSASREKRSGLVGNGSLPCPPWRIKESDQEGYCAEGREEELAIQKHNDACRAMRSRLTFISSTGSSSGGGVCSNDTSLSGTFRRYFSDKLLDDSADLLGYSGPSLRLSWVRSHFGVTSVHRRMRQEGTPSVITYNGPDVAYRFRPYLRDEDHPLFNENAIGGFSAVRQRTKTFNGLLRQLENLGHAPAPHTEGLNVQLLDFQRQTVGWAVERENAPGGVQSYFWTKVPQLGRSGGDLYFNPIFDMFSHIPPRRVRGGLLCEQMGLGKTVISLALVLQNPAPAKPESGTLVEDVPDDGLEDLAEDDYAGVGWTPAETPLTEDAPPSRGSIFSQGTLVICNVSLVGQWIDEAKSKLRDPGLVYGYHGSSRSRDAAVLAGKSIVVTTYHTLASDINYHGKKSGLADNYCPPCEQVRWWRVICDESHVMRDMSNNTRAVLRLAAENRWCVTGTPMNTSVMDLRNQMKFIGIEHSTQLFELFSLTMSHHAKSGRKRHPPWHNSRHECGNFLFCMRSIMMRHTMEQKCRVTRLDLMSLPPKEERTTIIPFTRDERKEYDKLEATAREFYRRLKAEAGHELRRHYLKMFSLLMPLRKACSGGDADGRDVYNDDGDSGLKKKGARKPYEMEPGDDLECSICLEHLEDPCATRCKHVFCRECIEGVLMMDDSSGPCPICRENVKVSQLRRALLPGSKAKREPRAKAKKGRDVMFQSKFLRLLDELGKIRREEPEAKSLVFSQFTSTIEWMKEELPKHGFQFRTLSGKMPMSMRAKSLREFASDPPTTVFLLSMRAGAVGINLTQANRVFIMEPAMNPALEAQAIGRVHRLGQRKKVEVVRLHMENSVDTRMVQLLEKKFGGRGAVANEDDGPSGGDTGDGGEISSDGTTSNRTSDGNPGEAAAVGSLKQDKTKVTAEEFDLLFGCDAGGRI